MDFLRKLFGKKKSEELEKVKVELREKSHPESPAPQIKKNEDVEHSSVGRATVFGMDELARGVMASSRQFERFNGLRHLAYRTMRSGDHAKAAGLYIEALRNWPNSFHAASDAKYHAVMQGLQACRKHPNLAVAPSLREEGGFRPTGLWTRLYVNAALPQNEWEKWVDMALANQMRNTPQLSVMLDAVADGAMWKSWEYIPASHATFANEYIVRAQGFFLSIWAEARAVWITSFTGDSPLRLGSAEHPEDASGALVTVLVGDELISDELISNVSLPLEPAREEKQMLPAHSKLSEIKEKVSTNQPQKAPQVTETQASKTVSNLAFVKLQDAVTFKTEATNWLRAQNRPGTLIWFVLPYEKNQFYEPCFGVLADSVLFGKLDRAKSFAIACVPADSLSAFQWKISVEDPDEDGSSFDLVTDLIPVDKSSLAKLQYLAEQGQVHYLFYASAESSNFVWIRMLPEYNKKLREFYLLLKNRHEGILGDWFILSEASIEFADGMVIQLADIKDISAPQVVTGHPDIVRAIKPELEKGHGVVCILYVDALLTEYGALPKFILTVDRSTAVALAERIKAAKAALKQHKSERVIVGECEGCHHKLRVRAHAVKSEMTLTCKCGQQNKVRVEPNLIRSLGCQ